MKSKTSSSLACAELWVAGAMTAPVALVRATRVGGVVLCMHEASTNLAAEVVDDLDEFLTAARDKPVAWAGARIYPTPIRRNIKLAEAPSYGQTVFEYAPRSNGAYDYARLAEEMFGVDANLILPGIGSIDRPSDPSAADRPSPFEPRRSIPKPSPTEASPSAGLTKMDNPVHGG